MVVTCLSRCESFSLSPPILSPVQFLELREVVRSFVILEPKVIIIQLFPQSRLHPQSLLKHYAIYLLTVRMYNNYVPRCFNSRTAPLSRSNRCPDAEWYRKGIYTCGYNADRLENKMKFNNTRFRVFWSPRVVRDYKATHCPPQDLGLPLLSLCASSH
jgi:hypothetical protein